MKNTPIPQAFILALQAELESSVDGISEYDLMQRLKLQGYFDFLSQPALPYELFRAHFFLFHTLYLLSNQFLEKKTYILDIHTLNINLSPYHEGENALQKTDPLKSYYLDFNNLDSTSEENVYDMLTSFWNNYSKFENREEALTELGLQDPVDNKVIKEEYRRLIMLHHPDRGGKTEKLQSLNNAIRLLLG